MKSPRLRFSSRVLYGEGKQDGSQVQEHHEALLKQAQAGNEWARKELCQFVFAAAQKYARYYRLPTVYELVDFAQDVMVALVEQLGVIQRLRTWLPAVLVGQRAQAFRRHFQCLISEPEEAEAQLDEGSERLSAEEQSRHITNIDFFILMNRLSEPQRTVMILHCVDGMLFRDISELTGMKPSTVRMHFLRAKKRLHKYLNLHFGDGSNHGIDT